MYLFKNHTKVFTSDVFFVSTLVLANFLFRIHLFDHPISDFRETQTAFGVRSILRNGMSIFRADVPVFGPPWKLPFEFPLFQYCAAVIAKIFGIGEVQSSLITATIFFLASGVAFFILVRTVSGSATARIALVIYLFSAYGLHFGTRVSIEFVAVFFSLLAMISILKFFEIGQTRYLFFLFVSGSLGSLVKITTAVSWIMVGISLIILISKKSFRVKFLCFFVLFASITSGLIWSQYADSIKDQNPHTKSLKSENLQGFIFGSIRQRVDPAFWRFQFFSIFETTIGSFTLGFIFVLVATVFSRSRPFALICGAIFLSGPLLFSSLYQHEYYLNAVFPALVYLFALAVRTMWIHAKVPLPSPNKLNLSWLTAFGLVFMSTISGSGTDLMSSFIPTEIVSEYPILYEVSEHTSRDDNVILIANNWSPSYLFMIDRRGLMLLPDGARPDKSELGTIYKFVYWVDIETKPTVNDWENYFPTGINFETVTGNLFRIYPGSD